MAQVDFYILEKEDEESRYIFACKIAEKAWRLGNKIHIHTMSQKNAKKFDELLWSFKSKSFVPHQIVEDNTYAPVSIGYAERFCESKNLLINLCDQIPNFASSFPRIVELVTSEAKSKQKSRERYKIYKEQGHKLGTHKI